MISFIEVCFYDSCVGQHRWPDAFVSSGYLTLAGKKPEFTGERGRSHNADAYDNIYYNDIETIQRKTKLAVKRGGGIMIWQITVDTTGQFSLLKAINNAWG